MAKFNYSKEVEEKGSLGYDDTVNIAGIEYKVGTFSLFRIAEYPEDEVFKILHINDKYKYCAKFYKPERSYSTGFPNFKSSDYEAVTKLVISLMKRWERFGWIHRLIGVDYGDD